MGALETNTTLVYGVHMRESANDGSDFTNAAADYRIMFLGEDGLWHAKDSSGTVTEPFDGGSAGAVGFQAIAAPPGFFWSAANNSAPTASAAYETPITIASPMYVRHLAAPMQAAASGTYQWGLFDYSASVSAATKLCGGSGALNGTGVQVIAATGAPVLVQPGTYMLILHAPAANQGSMYRIGTTAGIIWRSASGYSWDDTPDVRMSMFSGATSAHWGCCLVGDLNGSGDLWT